MSIENAGPRRALQALSAFIITPIRTGPRSNLFEAVAPPHRHPLDTSADHVHSGQVAACNRDAAQSARDLFFLTQVPN